jgi:prepilin-type N-terminal cleavage/methylation domain-containing protein
MIPSPSRHRPRRAFTLTESIVALVILGISVPPMLWAIRQQHRDRVSPVMASRARWLATEKLEDIIADRHSTTRGYTYLASANYPAESPVTGYTGFGRTVTFTETGADLSTAGTGYKRATVTVTWNDPAGVPRTLSIAAILTDYSTP